MKTLFGAFVLGALSCGVAESVLAQRQGLEEIIVTATRREESLQDVPISVTVATGAFIQEGGYSDMEDLTAFLPNLGINDGFQGQSMSIRGVGTDTRNEAFEEAVAQFADGVYYGRDSLVLGGLFDLERIEVVRGPQPVFAGQSATAGAINSVSRKPGDEFDGAVMLQYGTDEETSFEAALGGPITDKFGIRVAGRYYDLPEAGYTETLTGQEIGAQENKSFRITTVWEPTDRFDFTFKYEHQDSYQNGTPTEFGRCDLDFATSVANSVFLPGVPALCTMENVLGLVDLSVYNRETHSGGTVDLWDAIDFANANLGTNIVPGSALFGAMQPIPRGLDLVDEYNHPQSRNNEADIFVGTLNWQIGDNTLTSTTSRVTIDKEDWLDPDESQFAVFTDQRYEEFEQVAQELTLTSPLDQTFAWMVGLYYQTTDTVLGINVHFPFGPPIPGVIAFSDGGLLTEEADWTSAFFTGTWNVTDTFRFNIGARYQESDKHGIYQIGSTVLLAGATRFEPRVFNPNPSAVGDVQSDDVLPEVGFQWDVTDNMMFYVKYAEAFKAGGFVAPPPLLGPPNPFTFLPEEAEGYEVGLKSFFADRLQLNIALFDTDFVNLQQFNFSPFTGFSVRNAAAVQTQGIEIDGRFAINDRWSLGFSGGYNDAVYTNYPDAGCNTIQNIEWINAGNPPGTCRVDASGRRLFGGGEWQTALHPAVNFQVGEFSARASMNMAWYAGTPSFFVPPAGYPEDPLGAIPGRHRFDLRVSFMAPSEQWEIALYGRDITDEEAWVGGLQSGFFNTTTPGASNSEIHLYGPGGKRFERGARWGVQANYFFGR
ncbi:MAG TPA: TonB-dependent receptor [Gammaproteobacteria bacterium]